MDSLSGTTFTKYGWVVCLWSLMIPFQHGYHISVLNQIQGVLTCKGTAPIPESIPGKDDLSSCIPMSDFTFSLITSIYTIGGLAGSLVANMVMDRWGRRGTNSISAVLITVFTALMGLSSSVPLLLISRFTIGVASGLGLCVGPIYISEISPPKIRGSVAEETSLLNEADDETRQVSTQEIVSVPQLLFKPELRAPLMIVGLAMIAQQISGVTAVFYYSNDLLAKSLPQLGAYISLTITVINVIMTFPPILLIERMGRKPLLAMSILGAIFSLVTVGFALDSGSATVASIAIVTFVMFYAIGLGPIPFVMIPEVSPLHAVSALSSVALSLSWSTSFVVGLLFLPIRNLLSGGDMYKEGRVFYVFGLLFCLASILLFKFYK
ncbi:hypothetical protein CVT25_003639 [Psilocybe cyanescens]|uniref:Major facilitator superfamily (MFS) profile domain-containing protein n=1 Tax=Psilocybe cyanescens TaxID=93625 RepID=A0A409WPC6_PSICY|nr:hypothetical protein CVT25_003639 [Psilocybe cyanescens]